MEGSLIVVDEAAYPWPTIDLKEPPEHIKYLSQHRKHGHDFLVITQSPKFVHPYVLENADRHIHLSQEWSGSKSYEWSEFCSNPKLKTNRANAVKKPYKLEKKAFDLYYYASLHVEKPKRAILKWSIRPYFYCLLFQAMAMFIYGRITERLADPTTLLAQEKVQEDKQESKPLESQPVQAVQHVVTTQTKTNLSMVSDLVDWSQVAACVDNKNNCVCYGHKAQRLSILPETCSAAVKFGWLSNEQL